MLANSGFRRAIVCCLLCSLGFHLAGRLAAREKHREKKVKFGREVLIALGNLEAGGTCILYRAFLSSGDFFDGLERVEGDTVARFEFRKNGAVVTTFPNETQLGLDAQVTGCSNGPSVPIPPPVSPDLWQHPRFEIRWKRSAGLRRAKVLSLEVHQVPWQETKYVWYYLLKLDSKDVPLGDQLEMSVLGQDAERVAVLAGGLTDPWVGMLWLPPDEKRPGR